MREPDCISETEPTEIEAPHPAVADLNQQALAAHERWLYESTNMPVDLIARFTGSRLRALQSRIYRQKWQRPPPDAEIPYIAYPYADVAELYLEAGIDTAALPEPFVASDNMRLSALVARLTAVLHVKLRQLQKILDDPEGSPSAENEERYFRLLNAAADLLGKLQRNREALSASSQGSSTDAVRRNRKSASQSQDDRTVHERTAHLRDILKQRLAIRTGAPEEATGERKST